MGDVLHDVLQLQDFVSLLGQRTELDADLALAGSRDFMMVHFGRHADFFERGAHRRTDVLQAVDRWHRKVAALHARTMPGVAFGVVLARVPRSEEHTSELQSLMRISYAVF